MGQALHAFEPATDGHDTTQIDIQLRVVVSAGSRTEPVEGVVVSIAADGLLVQAPVTPPIGTQVTLSFRMLAQRVCEARGRVTWQRDDLFGVALEERNPGMDSFLHELFKLPSPLRQIYLADVLHPRVHVAA